MKYKFKIHIILWILTFLNVEKIIANEKKLENKNSIIDRVYLDIHGYTVTYSEFESLYNNYKALNNYYKNSNSVFNRKKVKETVIETQILKKLFYRYNLKLKDDYVNQLIEDQKQNFFKQARKEKFKFSNQEFQDINEYLKFKKLPLFKFFKEFIMYNAMRQELIRHMVQSGFINLPNEKTLKEVFLNNKNQFYQAAQSQIAHIVISIRKSEEDKYFLIKKKEELAEKIHKRLKKNPALFSELSKKYSDDIKTKYNGGIIGWLDEKTLVQISPEYLVAFSLKKGQISDLIWTDKGLHIIKLLDKEKEKEYTFLEAKKYVENFVLQEKANQLLQKIIEQEIKYTYIISNE